MSCRKNQVRSGLLLPALAAAFAAGFVLSVTAGSVHIPAAEVLDRCRLALLGRSSGDVYDRILIQSRLPRVFLGASVGAALSLAGLSAQTLFRNPLASPYTVGVSGGAAVGAVIALLLAGTTAGMTYASVPVFSVSAGIITALAVFLMAKRGRSFSNSLLLAGIAISAFAASITSGALYAAGEQLQVIVFWMMGGLWRASWGDVLLMLPVSVAAFVVLSVFSPAMNVALTGERSGWDLGVRVERLQRVLLAVLALTTALSVSLTGIIGFVGLIVPHLARICVGCDNRRLVPVSAVFGALILMGADVLARTAGGAREIPVGILTALVGAPVFLWMLMKKGAGTF